MPDFEFRLTAVLQTLENQTHLAEALFFPEVSCYGDAPDALLAALRTNARRLAESSPTLQLHCRHAGELPEVAAVTVVLDPPPRSAAWREPVTLTFHAVRWVHGEAHVAFVPALGIEVVAGKPEELEPRLAGHLRAALLRSEAATSLGRLVWLQRGQTVQVESLTFTATLKTPKQQALADEEAREAKKSVLEEVATDLTARPLPPAYEMEEVVSRLAEALTGRHPRSVLLVGPSGAGKTAAVQELVRRRRDHGLGRTPFWTTSGSRLVAGMSGFGMWEERCQKVWREAVKTKAILHLGNLVELMEVGKSDSRGQGIASFLRPYLGRGDLLTIVECTPEQVPVIERQDPHLLEVFARLAVDEPGPERSHAILRRFAEARPAGTPPLGPEGLATLDRLHRRYATYSAYPGRPLRFLTNLLHDRPDGQPLGAAEVIQAFTRETGLPRFLLEDAVRLDLDATRDQLARRVIGQPEAVDLVVDLLATVKAGLTRPRKPIASLLFIGPTGVGKTEMAKSLAEFLFGDVGRLTRLDMSEYADEAAVQRLIGGGIGAEGVLTARIREQPFAVVLLDEFEKAHPLLFDLLLQVLGEGRLTDAAGRLADFSNAVVIMTSNLGAETFQQGAFGLGAGGAARGEAREHFTRAVRAAVRPELFNRIDRIVAFAPLDEATIGGIARRQLDLLQQRDGIRYRGVTLSVAPEVAGHLAARGYDARYGARPLKRALERELLAPLAERMNQYAADAALMVQVSLDGGGLCFHVRAQLDDEGRQVTAAGGPGALGELARAFLEMRRNLQRLQQSAVTVELYNDVYRLEHLERRLAKRPHKSPEELERLARLARLRRITSNLESFYDQVCALEDEVLVALHGSGELDEERCRRDLNDAPRKWLDLLLALYTLRFPAADFVTVVVFSEEPPCLFTLAAAYHVLATEAGARVSVWQLRPHRGGNSDAMPEREQVLRPAEFLAQPREGVLGIALAITAPNIYLRLEPEHGIHHFTYVKGAGRCLVETSTAGAAVYEAPRGISRKGAIPAVPRRRSYNWQQGIVEDALLDKRLTGSERTLKNVLAEASEQLLLKKLLALVEQ
jgi:ATP-dependent Clp protease ATP-binding subunit ClpA